LPEALVELFNEGDEPVEEEEEEEVLLLLVPLSLSLALSLSDLPCGPKVERRAGRNTRPWNTPYRTVRPNILKNVLNTCDCENGRIMTARKVVTPPLTIAGPRLTRAVLVLSVRVPSATEKA